LDIYYSLSRTTVRERVFKEQMRGAQVEKGMEKEAEGVVRRS